MEDPFQNRFLCLRLPIRRMYSIESLAQPLQTSHVKPESCLELDRQCPSSTVRMAPPKTAQEAWTIHGTRSVICGKQAVEFVLGSNTFANASAERARAVPLLNAFLSEDVAAGSEFDGCFSLFGVFDEADGACSSAGIVVLVLLWKVFDFHSGEDKVELEGVSGAKRFAIPPLMEVRTAAGDVVGDMAARCGFEICLAHCAENRDVGIGLWW